MTQIQELLAKLPECIQASASAAIVSSGCGSNIPCICSSTSFVTVWQGAIYKACSPADGEKTWYLAHQLCTSAIPSLNDSKSPIIIGTLVTLIILSISSVILRVVARRISKIDLGWDDYLIMIALILTWSDNLVNIEGANIGAGKHIITLSPTQFTKSLKIYLSSNILVGQSVTAIRISILFFYRRIFPSRTFTSIIIITGCVQIAFGIGDFLTILFSCTPIQFFWNKMVPGGHCVSSDSQYYTLTGINLLLDVWILLMPIPSLSQLQLPRGRKLALICIFAIGCFACIATVVRIPLLAKINELDTTWTIVDTIIWLQVETNMGIVCACLPTLRPLVRFIVPAVKSGFSKAVNSNTRKGISGQFEEGKDDPELPDAVRVRTTSTVGSPDLEKQEKRKSHKSWYHAALASITREEYEEDFRSEVELVPVRDRNQVTKDV